MLRFMCLLPVYWVEPAECVLTRHWRFSLTIWWRPTEPAWVGGHGSEVYRALGMPVSQLETSAGFTSQASEMQASWWSHESSWCCNMLWVYKKCSTVLLRLWPSVKVFLSQCQSLIFDEIVNDSQLNPIVWWHCSIQLWLFLLSSCWYL